MGARPSGLGGTDVGHSNSFDRRRKDILSVQVKDAKKLGNHNGKNGAPRPRLACVAMFLTYMPWNAKSDEVLSPAAQRGFIILKTNCSRCHAIGKIGESPLKIAPPFRTLHERYPVEDLEKPLAEGIITGHPTMPEFRFRSATSSRT